MKIDRAFCDAMERAGVGGMLSCYRSARARFPDVQAETVEIAGGIAVFAGVGSPFSQAGGIGLWERAGRDAAETLTTFYRDRGAQPKVCVAPYADHDFVRALIECGYVPLEYENALTADLAAIGGTRDSRVTEMHDAQEWSRAAGSAFTDGAPVDEMGLRIGLVLCTSIESTALEIRDDGIIVAVGCMDVQGEIGGFFGGATAPAYRRQGLQGALIGDRVARMLERGARYGRATTEPGSISEQNFRRVGFVPLYTRTTWGLPAP